jgi:D-tagatose-1,6-bisphosphate aldolase subunit GatZ/KbaZ
MSAEILDSIVHDQKNGKARGITSICSAHPFVLEVVMERAARRGSTVLVESTCNQVNQFGGYTGMTPESFVYFVHKIALDAGLTPERVILGGDHLGPNVWQNEPAEIAMANSADMVEAYIKAGYTKIHLDASMRLGDDNPLKPLPQFVSAHRAALLAAVAEQAHLASGSTPPRYVVGTEVPVPGGAQNQAEELCVTEPQAAQEAIDAIRTAFQQARLESAFKRVIALVVQPGVEFGDQLVHEYQPEAARSLVQFIEGIPNLVYEAHSTDYQTRQALINLVQDHFAILKVGPALTFAFREAVFALAIMENELIPDSQLRSNLIQVLETVMQHSPQHWSKYYHGNEAEKQFARKYSFSDRARYYWSDPSLQTALNLLFANLGKKPLPLALISQFSLLQYEKIRTGEIKNNPQALIRDRIGFVLENYEIACGE